MLAPPASLATIQFAEVEHPYVAGETLSVAARDGVLHGLGAWMRLELAPGIGFTNSPLEADSRLDAQLLPHRKAS